MARTLIEQWSDKKPFTRRVRRYAAGMRGDPRRQDIRQEFEDVDGVFNKLYQDNIEAAERDFRDFQNGGVTVSILRREANAPLN